MHCGKFEQRLYACLDRDQIPEHDQQLMRHTQQCSRCHELLAAHQQLLDSLYSRSLPNTTDGFTDIVVCKVKGLCRRRRWWAAAQYAITGSVAALLLLLLHFSSHRQIRTAPVEGQVGANGAVTASFQNTRTGGGPSLIGVARVARLNNWAQYADRIPAVQELLPARTAAEMRTPQMTSSLAQSLRPVASSLASALKVIGSYLPASQRESSGKRQAGTLRPLGLALV
jgi:hypothetical protein